MIPDLEERHAQYLAAGADKAYALSLPIAKWLDALIDERKSRRILDIGSGFTSYITRRHDAECTSIDEDQSWAQFTRDFLLDTGSRDPNVTTDLAAVTGKFDLVILDAGYETHRMQLLRRAAMMVQDGGLLVIDDGHFPGLHRCCKVYAKLQGYEFADHKDLTDEYGRFPMTMNISHEPKQQETSICLAIPRALVCYDEAFMGFMRIAQQGWALVDQSYTMIPYARESIAKHLLSHPEFTHTVTLDQDHVHPPDIVMRLAKRVDEDRSKLVVAALNYRRGPPHDPVGYWDNGKGKLYTVSPAEWGTEMRTVDVVGLSAAILARECFEAFGPPWFDMDWSLAWAGAYPGEDTCFSRKAKAAGIQLWVDPTICSPHLTMDVVDRTYHERWVKEHPEELANCGDHDEITIDKDRWR